MSARELGANGSSADEPGNEPGADALALLGDASALQILAGKIDALDAQSLLRFSIKDLFPGKIALVSSFGAIPPCCCIWPRKSTRRFPCFSSKPACCFPRRSPIATA